MKFVDLTYYVQRDLFYRRGRTEIITGMLLIVIVSVALAVLFSFSEGTKRFVDQFLQQARPIMGNLDIRPQGGGFLTEKQMAFIRTLGQKPQVKAVSMLSGKSIRITDMQFYKNAKSGTKGRFPSSVLAVHYNDPMLDENYGLKYLKGTAFKKPDHTKPMAGIIVNTRFLKRLGLNKTEIAKWLEKDRVELVMSFRKSLGKNRRQGFKLPKTTLPITGIFELGAPYPDMFISIDIARATFKTGKRQWHSSYPLQFVNQDGQNLVPVQGFPKQLCGNIENDDIPLSWIDDKGKQASGTLSYRNDINILTCGDCLKYDEPQNKCLKSDFETNQVPYIGALLWFEDYKNPKVRKDFSQLIENQQLGLKSIEHGKTLGNSLQKVNRIVEVFVYWSVVILLLVSFFATLVFGFGHIRRKRQDIALLKSCGMRISTVGLIFLLQISVVGLLSCIIGMIITALISPYLDTAAIDLLGIVVDDLVLEGKMLILNVMVFVQSVAVVFAGMLLGSIIPMIIAMRVEPAEDLKVQQ